MKATALFHCLYPAYGSQEKLYLLENCRSIWKYLEMSLPIISGGTTVVFCTAVFFILTTVLLVNSLWSVQHYTTISINTIITNFRLEFYTHLPERKPHWTQWMFLREKMHRTELIEWKTTSRWCKIIAVTYTKHSPFECFHLPVHQGHILFVDLPHPEL